MGKVVPSPTVVSRTAAVLTPTPGMGKRVGLQQSVDLRFQGSALFVDGGERAGQGRDHDVEVPVPGTTMVCSSRASKTSSISRAVMRGGLGPD